MLKRIFGFILIAAFSVLVSYGINSQFLKLSERSLIDQKLMVFFLACSLSYILFMLWVDGVKVQWAWNPPRFDLAALRDNLPGILLSSAFVFVYLRFALILNNFGVAQVDNLFDADVGSWMRRIAFEDVKEFEMRGPHPFTYFIFRPFGQTLNLFTQDPTFSAILLTALVGGLCIYLTWLLVKRKFGSKTYAFLMASLLGVSASHFAFGSIIETYIYSALALVLFCLLVLDESAPPAALVAAGALTFGITLTNFIQNFFAFIVVRPRWREIIRFAGWTIAISLLLTYLHAYIYPASKLFFLVPDVQNEDKFFLDIFLMQDWMIRGRILYLIRTLFFYSVVAPKVFILTEEVGSTIPEFRFYKISPGIFHQTDYDGMGQVLIIVWASILAVSGLVFLWKLLRERKLELPVALILCLLFNFAVHVNYGQELFLYSPDWTYALVLFAAFGLSPFAKNRFFQAGMFVFLVLLAYNQWQFMSIILNSLKAYVATLPPVIP